MFTVYCTIKHANLHLFFGLAYCVSAITSRLLKIVFAYYVYVRMPSDTDAVRLFKSSTYMLVLNISK